ncbi:dermokine isoform 2-T2 [Dugong dugon]
MKLQGSLAYILLALCLCSGEAGPVLSVGDSTKASPGEASGQGVEEAISEGIGKAIGQGVREVVSSGDWEAMGPGWVDAVSPRVGEATHALGNTGKEASRQAKNGLDAAQSYSQGVPSSNDASVNIECTNPKPTGSRGSSSNSEGSSTSSSSSSTRRRRGGRKPECENPENEVRVSGGSGGQGVSQEGFGSSQGNYQNLQTSPGFFNFDTFWKNLKSKLNFINWDVINKSQVLHPSTRALLYFSRLWEDFKQNTPFFNWKGIIEGTALLPQKKAADTYQNNYSQQSYPTAYAGKTPAKGEVTLSSSASRAQPGLPHWMKFW